MNRITIAALLAVCLAAQTVTAQQEAGKLKPGVPEVQGPFASLEPSATWKIGRSADWVLVTDDAVWVAGTKPYSVQRIDPATDKIVSKISLPGEACSGLAFGFGSLWVPVCGKKPLLVRVDSLTNRTTASTPIAPAGPEGGITASSDSIWMVTDKSGSTLSRIDRATNTIRQKISIPAGSYNPLSTGSIIWVTGFEKNTLTPVDASSGEVLTVIDGNTNKVLRQWVGHGGDSPAVHDSIWLTDYHRGLVWRIPFKTVLPSAGLIAVQQEPVPIEEEPHHHVLLKNEFIEVIRATFAPGESTLFHTHSYDNAGVMLSKDTTTDQPLGKPEGPPETTQAGEVWAVPLPDGKPYTHRVHDVGDTTHDVFLVQFLQAPRSAPAPPVATVAAENAEARVYNWLLAPGATSAMHTHERPYVIVAATLLRLKITTADGRSFAEEMKPGHFHWVDPKVRHTLTNEGAAQGQIVEIELK